MALKKILNRFAISLCCLCISLNVNNSCAAEISLYSVQLDAIDLTSKARKNLFKQALPRVLIQLSGNDKILSSSQYSSALKKIDSYVQLYEYKDHKITIQFNKAMIDKLLTDASVAIWSDNRPVTVLWLQAQDNSIRAKLMQYAKARGVLLITPMLDYQDRQLITKDALNEFNKQQIIAATKRYHSNVALAGEIKQLSDENTWESSWMFLVGDDHHYYNNNGADLDLILQEVIEVFSNKLATDYAEHHYVKKSAINTITISITGITNLQHYMKTMQYLQQLPQVQDVCSKKLKESEAMFLIKTTADYETIKQNIEVSHMLQLEQENSYENHLNFRLL